MNSTLENKNSKNKYFFLSPHLDDIVFSCGGLIAKTAAAGCLVNVITFYTHQNDPAIYPTKLVKTIIKLPNYHMRQNEDIAALTLLGAKWTHLDYIDRFFRPLWLKNIFEVYDTSKIAGINSFENLAPIKKYITKLVEDNSESYFFAPLGIGNHYDHVELFLASIMTAKESNVLDRFFFYEDIYVLGERIRKKHPIARQINKGWCNLPSYNSIIGIIWDFIISSNMHGPNLFDYLPEEYQNLKWSVNAESIKDFLDIKIKAAANYKTQVKPLGGLKSFSKIISLYHKFWKDSEPYWVVK
ncbi:MAG: PIG-L deacetylase family protein [Candidatus Humimicrobiaceae bacterium]